MMNLNSNYLLTCKKISIAFCIFYTILFVALHCASIGNSCYAVIQNINNS